MIRCICRFDVHKIIKSTCIKHATCEKLYHLNLLSNFLGHHNDNTSAVPGGSCCCFLGDVGDKGVDG